MKAIIVGSSGLIGNELLHLLLADEHYDSVEILVRNPLVISHQKLQQIVVDFDRISELDFDADIVFCTLGTTMKKAKTKEAFIKVDYEYPLQLARLCAKRNISKFFLVTALGSSSSSSIFYNQVKGKLEDEIKKLSLSSVVIFRPSMLLGNRNEFRFAEKIGQIAMRTFDFLLIGNLRKFKAVKARDVAQAMLNCSFTTTGTIKTIDSDEIERMSRS